MQQGEGERLHAARRRRYWLMIGGLGLIGAIGGFVSGFIQDHAAGSGTGLSPAMTSVAVAGVFIVALLAAWASWRFFVTVDEVEVADNLWGSLIGFYTYAILLPVWWSLEKLGRAPEPDQWVIFFASMTTAMLVYLVRKWRAR
jgi:hypothetical protein